MRPSSSDDRLDDLFQALANRTRRNMLARLARGPATVTELAEPFAMSLPAVSKHLRVLERSQLVAGAADGRIRLCSLRPETLQEAERWLSERRSFWERNLEALAEHVARVPKLKR